MIKLQVIGNLGRDGIVREVNGKNVINFSVAHTDRFRDSAGSPKERTTWVDCSYWTDKTGVAPFLKKGVQVYAEGAPAAEAYTSKEGSAGVVLRLRVTNVQLLGSGHRENGSAGGAEGIAQPEYAGEASPDGGDDLPF